MKKLVPDPPLRPINTPFFTPESDIYPPLALAHVIELLRGVIETLDEHCRSHAGDAGLGNPHGVGQGIDERSRTDQKYLALNGYPGGPLCGPFCDRVFRFLLDRNPYRCWN